MKVIKVITTLEHITQLGNDDPNSEFQKTVSYRNYTNNIIKIRDRSGFVFTINPSFTPSSTAKEGLVVRMEFKIGRKVADVNRMEISQKREVTRTETEKLFLRIFNSHQRTFNPDPYFRFVVYYLIEKEDLAKNDGVNYLEATDGSVYYEKGTENIDKVYPPGSTEESLKLLEKEHKASEYANQYISDGLLYAVTIVDNESEKPPTYYTNVHNEVIPVVAIRRPKMISGIYLTRRGVSSDVDDRHLEMTFCCISQRRSCPVPIYDSAAEANQNPMNPDLKLLNAQTEAAHRTADKHHAELAAMYERQRIEAERNAREEAAFARDEAERKRKNTIEFIKYVPVIINTIIVLATLLISVASKTPIKPPIKA